MKQNASHLLVQACIAMFSALLFPVCDATANDDWYLPRFRSFYLDDDHCHSAMQFERDGSAKRAVHRAPKRCEFNELVEGSRKSQRWIDAYREAFSLSVADALKWAAGETVMQPKSAQ